LGDEGDLAAQGLRVPAAERLAVDADVAIAGFVEPGDELEVLCV
jgi:Flp pilus assembly protein CpaB